MYHVATILLSVYRLFWYCMARLASMQGITAMHGRGCGHMSAELHVVEQSANT